MNEELRSIIALVYTPICLLTAFQFWVYYTLRSLVKHEAANNITRAKVWELEQAEKASMKDQIRVHRETLILAGLLVPEETRVLKKRSEGYHD